MHRHGTTDRIKLILCFMMIAIVVVVIGVGGARSSAVGENAKPAGETTSASATQTPSASPAEKLEGCLACHSKIEPMHKYGPTGSLDNLKDGRDAQGLTCTACHGGNPVGKTKEEAHVRPRYPDEWKRDGRSTGANPERTNTLLLRESYEFVRFINPGDLRVAKTACGECHSAETQAVPRSMMAHGAMLWGAALYNNGGFPQKDARFGESYSASGAPQR